MNSDRTEKRQGKRAHALSTTKTAPIFDVFQNVVATWLSNGVKVNGSKQLLNCTESFFAFFIASYDLIHRAQS